MGFSDLIEDRLQGNEAPSHRLPMIHFSCIPFLNIQNQQKITNVCIIEFMIFYSSVLIFAFIHIMYDII